MQGVELPAGYVQFHYAEIGSTNDEAARLVSEEGRRHGTLVTAALQRQGRGRRGRAWVSEPGNLYASLVVVPLAPRAEWPQLSFVMALALADALQPLLPGHAVTLKWPNDVLVDGGKIAGILLEIRDDVLIIGFGVNRAHHPAETSYAATDLFACGVRDVGLENLLSRILAAFNSRYLAWEGAGFPPLRAAWLEKAHNLNKSVTVRQGETTQSGKFIDITPGEGALVLKKPDGSLVTLSAGDVYT